jgi:hypothetical protein
MNTLFLIALIFESIFGIGFIFIPGALLSPMGVILGESAKTFAHLFGSAIISFPVLLFFAIKSDKAEFKNGVVKSMSVYYFASTILLLITQLNGQMNSMGWSVVGLHLLLLIWFGYFLFKKAVS